MFKTSCAVVAWSRVRARVRACMCACVSHLCVAREAGPHDAGQQLAVYGCGRDDLGRGHGGDALQSLLFGTVVLGRRGKRVSTGTQPRNHSLSPGKQLFLEFECKSV